MALSYSLFHLKDRQLQDESHLLLHLVRVYDRELRPLYNASNTVVVNVGIMLTQIFDLEWAEGSSAGLHSGRKHSQLQEQNLLRGQSQ